MAENATAHVDFELLAPATWTAPVIFNSPHSGSNYRPELLQMSRLSACGLRKSEDCHVDELFMGCLDHGVPLVRALCPRAWIDLNREPYEFDPRLFEDDLPGYMNTSSPRVAGGLGTIPRIVAEGEEIYRGKLKLADALQRVESVYRPYHRMLQALVDESLAKTGMSLLIDCHSMPSTATHTAKMQRSDCSIVLGDRFGAACPPEITNFVEQLFQSEGLSVVRNTPYAGGFITHHYGTPRIGSYALQIEINRSIYMNETSFEPNAGFVPLRATLNRIICKLVEAVREFAAPLQQAAE